MATPWVEILGSSIRLEKATYNLVIKCRIGIRLNCPFRTHISSYTRPNALHWAELN